MAPGPDPLDPAARPCEVCGGTRWRPRARLDERTRVLRCRDCGLHAVDPLPTWEGAQDDFAELDLDGWIRYMERFRRAQYRKDIEVLRRHLDGGRVLDIGCGPGFFLDEIRSPAFEVEGIEAAPTAVAYGREHLGLDIRQGEFETFDLEPERYDLVTMFAVLEHMAHPAPVIERALRLLRPGGVLLVKVPRSDSLVAHLIYGAYRLSGGRVAGPLASLYDWSYRYPHLYHFSTSSLERLLTAKGAEVLGHRAESSINLDEFGSRLDLSGDDGPDDLGWARGRLARWAITTFVRTADLLRWGDDVIVYARKPLG